MTTKNSFAATVGLDWADQKHDLWLSPADGAKPAHLHPAHSPEAIHEWVAKLRERFQGQPWRSALKPLAAR